MVMHMVVDYDVEHWIGSSFIDEMMQEFYTLVPALIPFHTVTDGAFIVMRYGRP